MRYGKEKRDKVCAGQAGFTLIELVITIIILAIIAKIAGPAWVDMKSDSQQKAADLTRERLKAKWLAEKNSADRGAGDYPTLGRMVGYKAAVPPAPATIPVLLDYSFKLGTNSGNFFPYEIGLNHETSTTKYIPLTGQITCADSVNVWKDYAWAPSGIPAGSAISGPSATHAWLYGYSATKVGGTPESGASVGFPVPKCRAKITIATQFFSTSGDQNNIDSQFGGQSSGEDSTKMWWPWTSSGGTAYIIGLAKQGIWTTTGSWYGVPWPYAGGVIQDTPAAQWRMTCKGGESTYGVPYVISGYGQYAQDGKTVGTWFDINNYTNYYEVTPLPNRVMNIDAVPPTVGAAVCQRVGGPTTGNAEYLGNPPLALDYSGWCLGSGTTMKLPAYKDEAGTVPTSAYGDTVKAIGGKAVSDPVNCPAS